MTIDKDFLTFLGQATLELVGIGLTGPFKETSMGFKYVLLETCLFSKWVEAEPIDLTDYSFFTQWPRFRVKHLLEFVRSRTELQPCY